MVWYSINNWIEEAYNDTIEFAESEVNNVLDKIDDVSEVSDKLRNVLIKFVTTGNLDYKKLIEGVSDLALATFNKLVEFGELIYKAGKWLIDKITNALRSALNFVNELFRCLFGNKLIDVITSFPKELVEIFNILKAFFEMGSAIHNDSVVTFNLIFTILGVDKDNECINALIAGDLDRLLKCTGEIPGIDDTYKILKINNSDTTSEFNSVNIARYNSKYSTDENNIKYQVIELEETSVNTFGLNSPFDPDGPPIPDIDISEPDSDYSEPEEPEEPEPAKRGTVWVNNNTYPVYYCNDITNIIIEDRDNDKTIFFGESIPVLLLQNDEIGTLGYIREYIAISKGIESFKNTFAVESRRNFKNLLISSHIYDNIYDSYSINYYSLNIDKVIYPDFKLDEIKDNFIISASSITILTVPITYYQHDIYSGVSTLTQENRTALGLSNSISSEPTQPPIPDRNTWLSYFAYCLKNKYEMPVIMKTYFNTNDSFKKHFDELDSLTIDLDNITKIDLRRDILRNVTLIYNRSFNITNEFIESDNGSYIQKINDFEFIDLYRLKNVDLNINDYDSYNKYVDIKNIILTVQHQAVYDIIKRFYSINSNKYIKTWYNYDLLGNEELYINNTTVKAKWRTSLVKQAVEILYKETTPLKTDKINEEKNDTIEEITEKINNVIPLTNLNRYIVYLHMKVLKLNTNDLDDEFNGINKGDVVDLLHSDYTKIYTNLEDKIKDVIIFNKPENKIENMTLNQSQIRKVIFNIFNDESWRYNIGDKITNGDENKFIISKRIDIYKSIEHLVTDTEIQAIFDLIDFNNTVVKTDSTTSYKYDLYKPKDADVDLIIWYGDNRYKIKQIVTETEFRLYLNEYIIEPITSIEGYFTLEKFKEYVVNAVADETGWDNTLFTNIFGDKYDNDDTEKITLTKIKAKLIADGISDYTDSDTFKVLKDNITANETAKETAEEKIEKYTDYAINLLNFYKSMLGLVPKITGILSVRYDHYERYVGINDGNTTPFFSINTQDIKDFHDKIYDTDHYTWFLKTNYEIGSFSTEDLNGNFVEIGNDLLNDIIGSVNFSYFIALRQHSREIKKWSPYAKIIDDVDVVSELNSLVDNTYSNGYFNNYFGADNYVYYKGLLGNIPERIIDTGYTNELNDPDMDNNDDVAELEDIDEIRTMIGEPPNGPNGNEKKMNDLKSLIIKLLIKTLKRTKKITVVTVLKFLLKLVGKLAVNALNALPRALNKLGDVTKPIIEKTFSIGAKLNVIDHHTDFIKTYFSLFSAGLAFKLDTIDTSKRTRYYPRKRFKLKYTPRLRLEYPYKIFDGDD